MTPKRKAVEKAAAAIDKQLAKDEADWLKRADKAPDELAAFCFRQQAAEVAKMRARESARLRIADRKG